MGLDNPANGYHSLNMYYASGVPWVTSSTVLGVKEHHFQCVTRDIRFTNHGTGDIFMGFTRNAFSSSHFVHLVPSESIHLECRVVDLFLSSSSTQAYELYAGLTLIGRRFAPVLTGSAVGTQLGWDGVG